MSTIIPLSDEALRAIAQAVWDKFNEPRTRGVKPKCFCGHCANCRQRRYEARKRERRNQEREAAAQQTKATP